MFLNIRTHKYLILRNRNTRNTAEIFLTSHFAKFFFSLYSFPPLPQLFAQCFSPRSRNLLIAPEKKERVRIQLDLDVEMLAYSLQQQIRQSRPNLAYSSQQQILLFPSRPLRVKKERKKERLDSENYVACSAASLAWMGTSLAGMGTSLAKSATSLVASTGSFAR
jgi:hypothetical protein